MLVCEAYLLPNSVLDAKKKQQEQQKLVNKFDRNKTSFPNSFDHQSLNKSTTQEKIQTEDDSNPFSECLVVSMFFNPESGLLVYDSYPRGEIYSKLISVRIPYHFFVTKVICYIIIQDK